MTAKKRFDNHIESCREALEIYKYLESSGNYKADFGLRYIWVASVSALDHYISEKIVECTTIDFSQNHYISEKLRHENIPMNKILQFHSISFSQAILEFRNMISLLVRFQTFQKSKDISRGMSYIWSHKGKWNLISKELLIKENIIKETLNNICSRRDLIVHNSDYDSVSGELKKCTYNDALECYIFIRKLVAAIDNVINNR